LTTTTSYLSVHLTATDSTGLSATVVVDIQPRLVNLIFDTVPSGLPLLINQDKYETPVNLVGWENDRFEIEAASRETQKDGERVEFTSWSDGLKKNVREFVVPSESDPSPIIANFGKEVPGEAIYAPDELGGDGNKDVVIVDEPKKSSKFVVGLLDMSVSVRFVSDLARRRRKLASESDVNLVNYVEEELKTAVADAASSAVSSAINQFSGSDYAPILGIRFSRKSDSAFVDDEGLLYTSTFGGIAIFNREYDTQVVPNAFALQTAQVEAIDSIEDELLSDLREFVAEAGEIALGYQHVRSVSADVTGKPSAGTLSSAKDEKDPAMTGLLVIAILLVLLATAGAIAFLYMRRGSEDETNEASRAHDRNGRKRKMGTTHGRSSDSHGTDEETPANSPVRSQYVPSDPHVYNRSQSDPYGYDGASVSSLESVASSIKDIARDMIAQLNSVLVGDSIKEEEDADVLSSVLGTEEAVEEEDAVSLAPVVLGQNLRLD